jgi:glycosyltransferase involved in cell wall biosynthesis
MDEGRVLELIGPSTGGIRRHVGALRVGLAARGWDVTVAGPHDATRDLGGDALAVPVPSGPHPLELARAVRRVRGARAGVDLVHAHGLKAGWTAVLARAHPLVLTVHNTVLAGQGGWTEPAWRTLERRLPRRAEAVIATSVSLGQAIAATIEPGRLWVIPPVGPTPRPTRSAAEVRHELSVPAEHALVVGVGRLHPQKGWLVLLGAIAQLRHGGGGGLPPLRVVIAGEGPQERELRARIAALGLGGVVELVGPRADPADLLVAADVVVVPSQWESGPLVLAEAMALGRPVVSTAVGFGPDLVEDGVTGRLVAVGDAAALAGSLASTLGDANGAASMAAAGVDRVAALLGPDRLIDDVAAVYRHVLRQP